MTYFCATCVVNWWPYMCTEGCCPQCGTGTKRQQEPASPDALELHQAVIAARVEQARSDLNHKLFEEYYAAREARLAAAGDAADATAPPAREAA